MPTCVKHEKSGARAANASTTGGTNGIVTYVYLSLEIVDSGTSAKLLDNR
jgi:hypothetical protein